ncbi:MAG TPA: hypothetical protein EYQ31_10875 [Candidatus Handelsmanbacteria bacterium]|nr:hypothetical protein [Candidatus Handelsmanbacteria bacterium]
MHDGALFLQFLFRRQQFPARELTQFKALNDGDLPLAVGAHRTRKDEVFVDAVTTVTRDGGGEPVAIGGNTFDTTHVIEGGVGCRGGRGQTTGGDDGKLEVVRDYGADHVINYRQGEFRDRVKEITGGRGVDLVYDPVGGDVFDQSLRCMAWHGRLVIVGFTSGRIPQLSVNYALIKGLSIIGCRAGEFRRHDPEAGRLMQQDLLAMANAGKLHPHVSHVLPFERTIEAMQLLLDRKVVGKVVVTMG